MLDMDLPQILKIKKDSHHAILTFDIFMVSMSKQLNVTEASETLEAMFFSRLLS